jgi:hypothetical protein
MHPRIAQRIAKSLISLIQVAADMMEDLEKQWPKVSPPSSPKQSEFLTGLMKSPESSTQRQQRS